MRFFVQGLPVPKGSTHSFKHKHTGNIITMASNAKAQKGWRERIWWEAKERFAAPTAEAVGVNVVFLFNRPKGHFGKKGLLPSAPKHKITTPDVDKLVRCVLDALTGVAWRDDSQVISVYGRKQFCEPGGSEGAWIEVAVEAAQEPPAYVPKATCHLCGQEHSKTRADTGVWVDQHMCAQPRAPKPYPEAEDEEGPITDPAWMKGYPQSLEGVVADFPSLDGSEEEAGEV